MKKAIAMILAALMLAAALQALTSCADGEDDGGKLTVVATIFPQYDFVRAIGGDKVNVTMLLAPAAESHTYEPTLADMALIDKADLFIYTGGGIDTWAEGIIASLGESDVKGYPISGAVSLICADGEGDHDHGHDHNHSHGHGDVCAADEHVWTSPKNAMLIFDGILEIMIELDPENTDTFRRNAEAYRAELSALDRELTELTAESAKKEIVVADRFPFLYLTEHYGLEYHAALSGCSVGQEPTAAKIAELCGTVAGHGIGYVFVIEGSHGGAARVVSEATGCGILTLHSCHNVSAEEMRNGATYLSLMKQNIENLRLALE